MSKRRGAGLGTLCGALVALAASGGALAAEVPSFTIASPAAGAVVSSPVSVVVDVKGAQIGKPTDGLDHLHVSIDGGPAIAVYKNGPLSLPMKPGKHTVAVELAGPTHQPLEPPKRVAFSVK